MASIVDLSGNPGTSNTWRLGAYGQPATGFFDGSIDNVRIYDRALTLAEIQTDMASRDATGPDTAATLTDEALGRRSRCQCRNRGDGDVQRPHDRIDHQCQHVPAER